MRIMYVVLREKYERGTTEKKNGIEILKGAASLI